MKFNRWNIEYNSKWQRVAIDATALLRLLLMMMTTIWLLRCRCLKFNWWHFCYSVTDSFDRIVAYQFEHLSCARKQLTPNDGGNNTVGTGYATTIVTKICNEFKQLVVIPVFISLFASSTSISRHIASHSAALFSLFLSSTLHVHFFVVVSFVFIIFYVTLEYLKCWRHL